LSILAREASIIHVVAGALRIGELGPSVTETTALPRVRPNCRAVAEFENVSTWKKQLHRQGRQGRKGKQVHGFISALTLWASSVKHAYRLPLRPWR